MDSLKKVCFSVLVLVIAFTAVPAVMYAASPVIINEFRRDSGTGFTDKEAIEFVLTQDQTAVQLESLYFGDSRAETDIKVGVYKFQNLSSISTTFKAGTIIVIGGDTPVPTEDIAYNPEPSGTDDDWNIKLKVGAPHPHIVQISPTTKKGDFAITDVVWIDNFADGITSLDSINWSSSPGAFGSAAKVTIPEDPSNVEFKGNIAELNIADNYKVDSDGSLGSPNHSEKNTKLVKFLRSPVVSETPPADAVNINKTTAITVRFSDDIDASTVTDGTFQIHGSVSGIHTAAFTGGGTDTVTADPDEDFAPGEIVTVTLTTGIKSTGGAALARNYVWQFTVYIPPANPFNLSAEAVSHDAIALSWTDNSDSEDGFIIERSDMMSGWITVGTVGANVTSFIDSGLSYSWEYSYRVRAWNADGSSDYSNIASAITWFHPYETCKGITLNGSESLYGATLQENAPRGTVIGILGTVEPTGSHRYELFIPQPPGIDNRFFVIDGNVLKTSGYANPDHEKKKELRISLKSVDISKPYAWCHDEFVITVTDVPEAPVFLHLSGYSGAVPENQPGSYVASIVTEDDPGDIHTYRLVSGEGDTDNALFYIEGNTLKTNPGIDYETKQNLSIRVQSTDQSGAAFERFITLTVKNTPDPPFLSDIGNVNTDDEVPASLNFTVSDQDTVYDYLRVSARSDNPAVLPDANIALSSTGDNWTAMLTPIVGKTGTAKITVTVTDGEFSVEKSFTLTVTAGPGLRAVTRLETVGDTTVYPGDRLRYSASITNDGDRDAADVELSLPLPDRTEYADSGKRSDAVYDSRLNLLKWTGDIPAGETVEIAFDLRVKADVSSGDEISWEQGILSYDSDGDGVNDADIKTGKAESLAEITVKGCQPGDANKDGDIGLADAVLILHLLCGSDTDVCADADMNDDGRIGIEEAAFILKMLSE